MREPSVVNKYNLTVDCIKGLKVADETRVGEPLFWRNISIGAWCMSGNTIRSSEDSQFGTYSSYWLGIRDISPDRVGLMFSSHGGMRGYKFNEFYNEDDIEDDIDLRIQEMALKDVNFLLDEGILAKPD